MLYRNLAEYYERLESTTKKLEKAEILAELYRKSPDSILPHIVLLSMGMIYLQGELELGISDENMKKIIAKASGVSDKDIEKKFKETGDLGMTAEFFISHKKQSTFGRKELTIEKVYENLRKLPDVSGKGSQEKKNSLVAELLGQASGKEAKYIVRTTLGEMRTGIAEGIVKDAIVSAFLAKKDSPKEDREKAKEAVEYAYNMTGDLGEVAKNAKEKGIDGLTKAKINLGRPMKVMLAEKLNSIEEALKKFSKAAIEIKYDGMRAICQKSGNKIWIFTRRMENVTKQFPDLVELCKKNLECKECVVEGEVWGIDRKSKTPLPFQVLSQRIHRKYDIEKMADEIPIQANIFDIIYLDGKQLIEKPFAERRKILERVVREAPGKFRLATQLVTDDVSKAKKFYEDALKMKQEGVMVKKLDAPYIFGRHVDGWIKVKPTLESLDLAIIGATWGTGKRTGWMGSFILGCRDKKTGEFLECGMLGTGVKEKKTNPEDITFKELTELLKPYIESEKGTQIKIKPKIIISVDYQEIQKSPNYKSGFALRFPRFIALRFDKGPEDADSTDRIKYLYEMQKKR